MLYTTIDIANATRDELKAALKEAKNAGLTSIDLRSGELAMLKEIDRLRRMMATPEPETETTATTDEPLYTIDHAIAWAVSACEIDELKKVSCDQLKSIVHDAAGDIDTTDADFETEAACESLAQRIATKIKEAIEQHATMTEIVNRPHNRKALRYCAAKNFTTVETIAYLKEALAGIHEPRHCASILRLGIDRGIIVTDGDRLTLPPNAHSFRDMLRLRQRQTVRTPKVGFTFSMTARQAATFKREMNQGLRDLQRSFDATERMIADARHQLVAA